MLACMQTKLKKCLMLTIPPSFLQQKSPNHCYRENNKFSKRKIGISNLFLNLDQTKLSRVSLFIANLQIILIPFRVVSSIRQQFYLISEV